MRTSAAGALRVPAPKCMRHVTARNGSAESAKPASGDAPNTVTNSWMPLRLLHQQVRRDLLLESKKHQAWRLLGLIPGIGPIRAALLIALIQTPYRFRTKQQLWTYSFLGLETHDSAQYRVIEGQLQRSKKPVTLRGLNQDQQSKPSGHDLPEVFGEQQFVSRAGVSPLTSGVSGAG